MTLALYLRDDVPVALVLKKLKSFARSRGIDVFDDHDDFAHAAEQTSNGAEKPAGVIE